MKTGLYFQDPKYAVGDVRPDFIFDPSLRLYVPLYQLDGASFMSKDAYGHLCTVTGASWRPDGREFDAVPDDYISVGELGNYGSLLGSTNITVFEGWIKSSDTTTEMGVLGTVNDGSTTLLLIKLNEKSDGTTSAGCIRVFLRDEDSNTLEAGVDTNTGITDGSWHHLKIDIDGVNNAIIVLVDKISQMLVYKDQTTPDNVANFQYALLLGAINNRGAPSNSFIGTIGEVRIYSRVLTPLETQHNYLSTNWRYR